MSFPPIAELVPHQPPMSLLDAVLAFDGEHACCRVVVRGDGPFAEHGRVPAWLALEYCAQTVAVFAGLTGRASGLPPRLGMLIAAREMSLDTAFFEAGEELRIDVRLVFGELRVGRFDCTVERIGPHAGAPPGSVVARASLSVYQPGDPDVADPTR